MVVIQTTNYPIAKPVSKQPPQPEKIKPTQLKAEIGEPYYKTREYKPEMVGAIIPYNKEDLSKYGTKEMPSTSVVTRASGKVEYYEGSKLVGLKEPNKPLMRVAYPSNYGRRDTPMLPEPRMAREQGTGRTTVIPNVVYGDFTGVGTSFHKEPTQPAHPILYQTQEHRKKYPNAAPTFPRGYIQIKPEQPKLNILPERQLPPKQQAQNKIFQIFPQQNVFTLPKSKVKFSLR